MYETKIFSLPDSFGFHIPKKLHMYHNPHQTPTAYLIYLHGGALIYGDAADLPYTHLHFFTENGYAVLALDYPLAPHTKLDNIIKDIQSSLDFITQHLFQKHIPALPFFLWGRSAGAYLCLLLAKQKQFFLEPKGIISYYGYGFLENTWYMTPSHFYCLFPRVEALVYPPDTPPYTRDIKRFYQSYVYARQNGTWISSLYEGRKKDFDLQYSLKTCDALAYPLFCTHNINDPDIPFIEFQKLCEKYHAESFIVSEKEHDFDCKEGPCTTLLLNKTLDFLDKYRL